MRVNNNDGKGLAWSGTSTFVQTLPVLLYHHLDPYSLQFPLAAATALVLLVPVLVVFVLSGRLLRDDLMASGMGRL